MHSDSKKRRSFLALLFAAGDVKRWGCGYATEAVRALVSYGFTELRLNRIQGRHLIRNPASGRVMQKIGMSYEGTFRQSIRKWDLYEDLAMYSILVDEWGAEKASA
jgi:[ribosomal protein S5]-alanine N-acetyltransferase